MATVRAIGRKRRHQRIRKKISGTGERPRFCVQRSLRHLMVQLIDDTQGKTLLGLATSSPEFRKKIKGGNKEGAKLLGQVVAEKAKALRIERVIFDRGGNLFHGRIRELAEAARAGGLKF